jgi:hypothetical protein
MPMLSRCCMASAFSWWCSVTLCFCANLCISLDTTSTSRSLWRSLFLMYQCALTMFLSTLFWNRCIMSLFLCLVQPQIWIPHVQTGSNICIEEVCYEETVRRPFLSANTLFYILGPVPLLCFDMGINSYWNVFEASVGEVSTNRFRFIKLDMPFFVHFTMVHIYQFILCMPMKRGIFNTTLETSYLTE